MGKKMVLVLSTLIVSCSNVSKIKNRVLGVNVNHFDKGTKISKVESSLGNPKAQITSNNEDYIFFESGFIISKNGEVKESKSYKVGLTEGTTFSTYVPNGTNLKDAIVKLGYPQEVMQKNKVAYLRFLNGALIVEEGIVKQSIDKLLRDDLSFIVNISSFSDSSAKKSGTYAVYPGSNEINQNDLQYKDLKKYIEQTLSSKGMRVVQNPESADYIVLVKYGISDPKEDIHVVSRPIFIPQFYPGQTTNVYGAYGNQIGSVRSPGQWTSSYAGQTTDTYTTVTHNRWLNIEAIDYKVWQATHQQAPVWKVLTNSTGPVGDFRTVLPALSFGIKNYINVDSGTQKTITADPESLNKLVYETKFYSSLQDP